MTKAQYMKNYLDKNPDQKLISINRWKAHKRERVVALTQFTNHLKLQPCKDCEVQYSPWVMHFDHRNPREKLYNVSSMVRNGMKETKILQEVAKCDVVCANCHAERTHKQRLNGDI